MAPPTANNDSATPSAGSRWSAPIGRSLRPATPPLPPVNAAVKNAPAAEGTQNGPPSLARIATPDRFSEGLNETDGKDDLRLQRPRGFQDPPDGPRRLLRSRAAWSCPGDPSEFWRSHRNTFCKLLASSTGCRSRYCRERRTLGTIRGHGHRISSD